MTEGLVISTADTPIASPHSSGKSSISLPSSRSLSPVSSNTSVVNSPQVSATSIQSRSSESVGNQYVTAEEGDLVERGRGGVERGESQNSNYGAGESSSGSGSADPESGGSGFNTSSRSSGEESGSESATTSPEQHVTRSLEKLTLKTKAELFNSDPRMKNMSLTLPPVAGAAHTRTSPLYSPSTTTATYPYYFVQKDGQVFNVEIPVEQASPASIITSSSLSPTYFPGTWTGTLSPTTLHPTLRPFSQQQTPRGEYIASPTGLYADSNFQQPFLLPTTAVSSLNPHHHPHSSSSHQPQHRLALTPPQPSPRSLAKQRRSSSKKTSSTAGGTESSKFNLLDDEGGSSSGTQSGNSSANTSPKKEGEREREKPKRKSKGRGMVDKEGKIDNKHTFPSQGKEVFREMFYTSEQPSTVLAQATPVGMIIPQTTTISSPTGEVHVSTMFSSPSQPKITPTPVPYPSGYPYTHVYYDPVTQAYYQALPYAPTSQLPASASSSPQAQQAQSGGGGGAQPQVGGLGAQQQQSGGMAGLVSATVPGVGILTQDPSSRAVYQFPIAGTPAQWGGAEPTYYMPRPPRGPKIRPGVCLFVFHIPPSVTDEELYALFSTCGRVLSAKVMRNAHTAESKGFGFVNMANQRDVEVAIGTLHGYYWKNKYLKVSYKKKRYHGRNQ